MPIRRATASSSSRSTGRRSVERARALAGMAGVQGLRHGFSHPRQLAAEAVAISEEYGWADNPDWTPAMNTAVNDMFSNIAIEGNDPEAELAKAVETVNTELDGIFG